MTVNLDELRARKRLLLEQKREAEEAGDKWEAAFVHEELLGINAQLRAITGKRQKLRQRDTSSQQAIDRKQFEDWQHREDTERTNGEREALREKAAASLECLTPRQREVLELCSQGMNGTDIAAKLGVDKSTACRTLARAKKKAADAVRMSLEKEAALAGSTVADMRRDEALRAVIRRLTAKQLMYFYLYYSEGLTLREIGALTGTDHSSICRTLKRALIHLDKLFPGGAILEHPEALDEAAYWAWAELDTHPELAPEPVQELIKNQKRHPAEYYRKYRKQFVQADPAVIVRRDKPEKPGRLLAALLERRENGLLQWLERVFEALRRKWRGEHK